MMNDYLLIYVLGFIFFLIIGFISNKSKNYYQGAGDYGAFTTTAGIIASFVGGGSIINLIELSNKYGYWAYADVIPASLGLIVAFFLLSKYRSNIFFNKTEYNKKLTLKVHHLVIVVLYTLVMVAQFIGLGKLASMIGLESSNFLILTTAALVWIYSVRGYSAVTNTDKAQFIIMVLGFYTIPFIAHTLSIDATTISTIEDKTAAMPLQLILALSLPLFFIPISQEIHQRASASMNEGALKKSLIAAGILYFILGSITIHLGVNVSTGGLEGLIQSMPGKIVGNIIFFAVLTALISTTDTALNISNHSLSHLFESKIFEGKEYFISLPIMVLAVYLSSQFPTILSVILLALFIYMSGPAFMSLSKSYKFPENIALVLSVLSIALHLVIKVVNISAINYGLAIIVLQYIAMLIISIANKNMTRKGECNG